jgi:CHASE2 domain-containing sensor protein
MYALQAILWIVAGALMAAARAWLWPSRRSLPFLVGLAAAAALAGGAATQLASRDPWSEAALVGAALAAAAALVLEQASARRAHLHPRRS